MYNKEYEKYKHKDKGKSQRFNNGSTISKVLYLDKRQCHWCEWNNKKYANVATQAPIMGLTKLSINVRNQWAPVEWLVTVEGPHISLWIKWKGVDLLF